MGIVKGFVIRKLFSIRNNIEHNERKYSNKDQCQDLLDTVWYFLKSTDNLVYESAVSNDLCDDIEKKNYVLTVDVEEPLIKVAKIRSKIFKSMLSYTFKEGYIELKKVQLSNINEDLIHINGEIVLNKELKIIIAKKFLLIEY